MAVAVCFSCLSNSKVCIVYKWLFIHPSVFPYVTFNHCLLEMFQTCKNVADFIEEGQNKIFYRQASSDLSNAVASVNVLWFLEYVVLPIIQNQVNSRHGV